MRKIAIYARKSVESDKGESIKNQIEECKNYLRLQKKEDFKEEAIVIYKDEGYSGKNTYRPDFQRLTSDIKDGR